MLAAGLFERIGHAAERTVSEGKRFTLKTCLRVYERSSATRQNVRLTGKAIDSRLSYVVGAFYFTEEASDIAITATSTCTTLRYHYCRQL